MLRNRLRRTKAIAARRFLASSRDPPPLLPQRRVVVTGLGLVTPLACGVELSWQRLLEKKSGVRALSIEDLKIDSMDDPGKQEILNQITSKVVATVPVGSGKGQYDAAMWMDGKEKYIAPFIGYALCAAEEALLDANWHPEDAGEKERTGVAIGGGIGCISDILNAAQLVLEKRVRRLSPFFVPRILINMAAGHVSIKYGFKGPNHAAVTACATGAHSVGDAARMIRFGDADVMVAGGTECSIDALSIAGFCRARALSTNFNANPGTSSRPFDRDRDGFVIGEGAGIMVLEEYEHAKRRKAKIYAEICGYGMSGDAYHITQPSTDGRGAILAMKRALKQSGLQPPQIAYVNAHATSTPLGDTIEAKAIQDVFLDHATSGALALSSTKGATGHLLGAAGAVEAIFSVLALHHISGTLHSEYVFKIFLLICYLRFLIQGTAPPTANLTSPDPIFSETFTPITSPKQMPINAVLTNSFGFGGTNASLVFASLQD